MIAARFLLCPIVFLAACSEPRDTPHQLRGEAMGTVWRLAWRGDRVADVESRVSETLRKWEDVMSQWRPDSDLSRFNRGEAATGELRVVMDLAETIREASEGAFDHRMLRETGREGFGPGGEGVDLSGIGKGFAVDRVGESLRELGVSDFVFELGGEILVGDGTWEVAIEKPDPAGRDIAYTMKLRNQALATSGNYRQFTPADGGLRSHILDPASRKPVIRPPCSVSVIASDAATADAWATALFVKGPQHPSPQGIRVIWNH